MRAWYTKALESEPGVLGSLGARGAGSTRTFLADLRTYHPDVNRTRVWLVVSPVVAAGVLTAHWLAYRLTSTPTDPFHGYLEHAPQVLLLLAAAGVILSAVTARGTRRHRERSRSWRSRRSSSRSTSSGSSTAVACRSC